MTVKSLKLKSDVIKTNKVEIDGEKINMFIEIITTSPKISHWNVKIDAETGQVVDKLNMIKEAATTGTGKGVLGDTKQININSVSGGTTRFNSTRYTFSLQLRCEYWSSYLMQDKDKNFVDDEQRAGVDANYKRNV